MFVFTMHAALPAISTSSALGLILFEGTAKRASGTSADVEVAVSALHEYPLSTLSVKI